jgi:hypothetical protein
VKTRDRDHQGRENNCPFPLKGPTKISKKHSNKSQAEPPDTQQCSMTQPSNPRGGCFFLNVCERRDYAEAFIAGDFTSNALSFFTDQESTTTLADRRRHDRKVPNGTSWYSPNPAATCAAPA